MKRNAHELREMVLRHIERTDQLSSFDHSNTNRTRWWWKAQLKNVIHSPEYALAQFLFASSMNSRSLVIATWIAEFPSSFIESAKLELGTNGFSFSQVRDGKMWYGDTCVYGDYLSSPIEDRIAALAQTHVGPPPFSFLADLIGEAVAKHINACGIEADRVREQQRAKEKTLQATAV